MRKRTMGALVVVATLWFCHGLYSSQLTPLSLEEIVKQGIFNRHTVLVSAKVKNSEIRESEDRIMIQYEVEKAKVIQGDYPNSVEAMEYSQIVPVIKDATGKITGSFSPVLPCTGIEFNILKGKEYIFFINVGSLSQKPLKVFRVEPIENRSKIARALRLYGYSVRN